jgi:hypothetical protein
MPQLHGINSRQLELHGQVQLTLQLLQMLMRNGVAPGMTSTHNLFFYFFKIGFIKRKKIGDIR